MVVDVVKVINAMGECVPKDQVYNFLHLLDFINIKVVDVVKVLTTINECVPEDQITKFLELINFDSVNITMLKDDDFYELLSSNKHIFILKLLFSKLNTEQIVDIIDHYSYIEDIHEEVMAYIEETFIAPVEDPILVDIIVSSKLFDFKDEIDPWELGYLDINDIPPTKYSLLSTKTVEKLLLIYIKNDNHWYHNNQDSVWFYDYDGFRNYYHKHEDYSILYTKIMEELKDYVNDNYEYIKDDETVIIDNTTTFADLNMNYDDVLDIYWHYIYE